MERKTENLDLKGPGGHSRVVRRYFLATVILISGGLITSGLLEVYFRYHENWDYFGRIQKGIVIAAATKIEAFVGEIERSIRGTTRSREIVRDGLTSEYQWELRRLLVNTPSITEAIAFDLNGVKYAAARRTKHVLAQTKWDPPPQAALEKVKQRKSYFGPSRFRDSFNADPVTLTMTISVPIERFVGEVIGILQTEIDLRSVGEVISEIHVGEAGQAYLVARSGELIAHPDTSLVLQRRKLAQLDYVKAAFRSIPATTTSNALVTRNFQGKKVFCSYALIPTLGWAVFVEQPVQEIYAPLYRSVLRTISLLMVGLGMALLATLFVRRRVVQPMEALRQGVERIRAGDLSSRLELKTGDEFEILSQEFNLMAANLKEAYSNLEQKVAERTEELTITNQRLEYASKHKSKFLASVNHELRTPISAVIGYARLILRETEGQISPLQRENLLDLQNNAERLLGMINDLLDFAKIEAGKSELLIQPVRIDELVQDTLATIEPLMNKDAVSLVRHVPATIAPVYTDREKLRQIILNLLGNAVKFTDRGEIKISARQDNGDIKLAVADTGIGIDEADLKRIFEEFDRGRLTNNNGYRGTGLGLTIVKRLAEMLGGSIRVESIIGSGSTFTVTLPVKRG